MIVTGLTGRLPAVTLEGAEATSTAVRTCTGRGPPGRQDHCPVFRLSVRMCGLDRSNTVDRERLARGQLGTLVTESGCANHPDQPGPSTTRAPHDRRCQVSDFRPITSLTWH